MKWKSHCEPEDAGLWKLYGLKNPASCALPQPFPVPFSLANPQKTTQKTAPAHRSSRHSLHRRPHPGDFFRTPGESSPPGFVLKKNFGKEWDELLTSKCFFRQISENLNSIHPKIKKTSWPYSECPYFCVVRKVKHIKKQHIYTQNKYITWCRSFCLRKMPLLRRTSCFLSPRCGPINQPGWLVLQLVLHSLLQMPRLEDPKRERLRVNGVPMGYPIGWWSLGSHHFSLFFNGVL